MTTNTSPVHAGHPVNPSPWTRRALGADQGRVVRHPSTILTLAGLGPLDADGRLVHEDDLAAQLALSLANLAEVLAEAGLGWPDVAQLTVWTTDLQALLDSYDTLVEHLDGAGAHPPATVVEVNRLLLPGMAVCIDGLAVR